MILRTPTGDVVHAVLTTIHPDAKPGESMLVATIDISPQHAVENNWDLIRATEAEWQVLKPLGYERPVVHD